MRTGTRDGRGEASDKWRRAARVGGAATASRASSGTHGNAYEVRLVCQVTSWRSTLNAQLSLPHDHGIQCHRRGTGNRGSKYSMSRMSRSTTFSSEESSSDVSHVLSHPHADIVLRSCDHQEFKVPKVYIIDNSPVLAKLIRTPSHPPKPDTKPGSAISTDSATLLPVVLLDDSGAILISLLSFIIPVPPNLPSTVEECVELLGMAQKYEMCLVLTHIRDHVARQNPPIIREKNAFYVYSLAQKFDLRREMDQAARLTLKVQMSIGDLEATGKLDILSGALLYQLWGYHQRVREYLASDFAEFMMFEVGARINYRCIKLSSSDVPIWLNDYINAVALNPALFNISEFHMALTRHAVPTGSRSSPPCECCAAISCNTIDTFWRALSNVVQHSIENVSLNSGCPFFYDTFTGRSRLARRERNEVVPVPPQRSDCCEYLASPDAKR